MALSPENERDLPPTPTFPADFSRLSAWVAHEINNPLGGIRNALALIHPAVPTDHPRFKFLEVIDREIARIEAVTNRLHSTYGLPDDPPQAITIAHGISGALTALEPLRLARNIEMQLDVDLAASSATVAGGPGAAAIRYLLQAGIEAAAADTRVKLSATSEHDRIRLLIHVYHQNDSSRKTAVAGPPGLAIRLLQQLVAALGGEVTSATRSDGTSDIRVALPILDPPTVTE